MTNVPLCTADIDQDFFQKNLPRIIQCPLLRHQNVTTLIFYIAHAASSALSWSNGSIGNNLVSVHITVVADSWGAGIRPAVLEMAAGKLNGLAGVTIQRCGAGSSRSG